MAELLVELLSEELPANVQAEAEKTFAGLLSKELTELGVPTDKFLSGSTPRRLVVAVDGIPAVLPATSTERVGPKTNSDEKIIAAFLKATGAQKTELLIKDTPKGECYILRKVIPERETRQVLAAAVDKSIRAMSWKKSMRWANGTFRWPRPLKAISVVFNGKVVEGSFDLGNGAYLEYSNQSVGHRFLNPGSFEITGFSQYKNGLSARHVVLDRSVRKSIIQQDAERIAEVNGLSINEDNDLLEEVVGLVEWPVVLRGRFNEKFLDVPPEVITASMKANQKYFSTRKPNGDLSSSFIFFAGTVTKDEGETVVSGNEKVISARLSDAHFFWQKDLSVPLSDRVPDLKKLKFHNKLGTMHDKTLRVAALAKAMAQQLGADTALAERAAFLSKADLVTSLVYEFPELQGIVGYRCALQQGEAPVVAEAVKSHYAPLGPRDACPKGQITAIVALADKIDTLTGFFGIGEVPRSSRDPFSLRRAALGMVRILLENNIDYDVSAGIALSSRLYGTQVPAEISGFVKDRIKSTFLDRGLSEYVISSILNNDESNNVNRLFRHGQIIQAFADSPEAADLLTVATRIRKILPKDWNSTAYATSKDWLVTDYDARLFELVENLETQITSQSFEAKLQALCGTKDIVTAFFENVLVNDYNQKIRENRIGMLIRLQRVFDDVCDLKAIKPCGGLSSPTRPPLHSSVNPSLDRK